MGLRNWLRQHLKLLLCGAFLTVAILIYLHFWRTPRKHSLKPQHKLEEQHKRYSQYDEMVRQLNNSVVPTVIMKSEMNVQHREIENDFNDVLPQQFIFGSSLYPLKNSNRSNYTRHSESTRAYFINFYNPPAWYTRPTLQECRVKCELTLGDRNLNGYDAVIIRGVTDLPPYPPSGRPLGQPWVMFAMESPVHSSLGLKDSHWNNVFNWTMTYRVDADCPVRELMVVKRHNVPSDRNSLLNIFKNKTKEVAWFVSNCFLQPSRRNEYVQELRKFIPVDIYGSCGTLSCLPRYSDTCDQLLNTTYKFFLAFENSLFRDYATEKMDLGYKRDVITIVRGGANYSKLFPNGTFINTADFKSIEDLAKYLLKLSSSPDLYLPYLERQRPFWIRQTKDPMCGLCNRLDKIGSYKRLYDSISTWHAPPWDNSTPSDLNV